MADRPNILLIVSDQHSPRVMGCAGDGVVRTPHLDALAERGTRFEHAYCASPLCVPSRMTMMTGRHCSDIRVWTNSCYLGSEEPTFAHALGAAGYQTVLSGRMHFMGPDQRHGFHERIIGDIGAYNPTGSGKGNLPPQLSAGSGQKRIAVEVAGPGRTAYQAYDEAVLEATARWLGERGASDDDRPFLLTMGGVLPHCPFVAREDLYEYYYERVEMPEIPEGYFENLHPAMKAWRELRGVEGLSDEQIRKARAGYYGLVEHFDEIVGGVLRALGESGMADDTIVIYVSDHGESAGNNGLWWKSQFSEDGCGVPMIVAGPGIPAGERRSEVVSLLDVAPTLTNLAGAPELPLISGQSLLPLLGGEPGAAPWRDEAIAELIGIDAAYAHPGRMIRRGPWKLIHYEGHEPMLFNLDEDPKEFVDRAGDPACRDVRSYLHDRVLAGWRPGEALRTLRDRKARFGLVRDWTRNWRGIPRDEKDFWWAPEDANDVAWLEAT